MVKNTKKAGNTHHMLTLGPDELAWLNNRRADKHPHLETPQQEIRALIQEAMKKEPRYKHAPEVPA